MTETEALIAYWKERPGEAMMVVSIALIAMIVLQIVDIKQLTLKQAGVAVLAMAACASVIGGVENGRKKDNSRH